MRLRLRIPAFQPLEWLRGQPAKARRVRARLLEATCEIGVLLIAFSPFDAAVVRDREVAGSLLLFLGLGFFLLFGALVIEWRHGDDA